MIGVPNFRLEKALFVGAKMVKLWFDLLSYIRIYAISYLGGF